VHDLDTRYLPTRSSGGAGPHRWLSIRKFAVLTVIALLLAVAYFGSRDDGDPSSEVTDDVELALTRAGFTDVSVTESDGVVIVTGTVETEAEQFAVGRVARSVADVVDIDNRVTATEAAVEETPTGTATAPALELQAQLSAMVGRDPIVFGSGNAELAAESAVLLDEITTVIAAHPGISIEIAGHTDADGEPDSNQTLSDQRAKAVLDYLVGQGAASATLSSVGYGESQPVASNDTGEGKELNRRIVFRVIS
jgi:OOP family OmpA-OmpF porin